MARVISVELKQVKHGCGALIEYNVAEAKDEYCSDYGGGGEWYRFLVCPNCGKRFSFYIPNEGC